jgi:hypothetical protein
MRCKNTGFFLIPAFLLGLDFVIVSDCDDYARCVAVRANKMVVMSSTIVRLSGRMVRMSNTMVRKANTTVRKSTRRGRDGGVGLGMDSELVLMRLASV